MSRLTKFLAYHVNLFLLAVSFFSRLPVTSFVRYSPSKMRRASQYFPLVGWLLAGLLSIAFYLLSPVFGLPVTICVMLILSVLLTGALHEDGIADSCDGIWGGMSTARKLDIMKDSRIGTYGTCALILVLLSKFVLWWQLAEHQVLVQSLLVAYPLSRAMAITLVQDMSYVSNKLPTSGSKSEPLAKPMTAKTLAFVLGTGLFATLTLSFTSFLMLVAGCTALRYWLKHWLNKHIQGYTGDTLGMAQQMQELLTYLILLSQLPRIGL